MPRGVAPRLPANAASTSSVSGPAYVVPGRRCAGRDGRPRRSGRPGAGRGVGCGRAAGQYLAWCGARGVGQRAIAPLHIAAYIRPPPGAGPDRQAAPRRHSGALRLARRPPGLAREPGRVGSEARSTSSRRARRPCSRQRRRERSSTGSTRGRWWAAGPGVPERDGPRAGERGGGDAAPGLLRAGRAGLAAAARQGRQAPRRTGPPPGRGGGRGVRVTAGGLGGREGVEAYCSRTRLPVLVQQEPVGAMWGPRGRWPGWSGWRTGRSGRRRTSTP